MELINKILKFNHNTISGLKQHGFTSEEILSEMHVTIGICNRNYKEGKAPFDVYAGVAMKNRLNDLLNKRKSINSIEFQMPKNFDKEVNYIENIQEDVLVYFKSLPKEIIEKMSLYWRNEISVEEMERACKNYRLSLNNILDNIDGLVTIN